MTRTTGEAAGTISVGGNLRGCGFLIGPQIALTANHVVRGRDGRPVDPSSVLLDAQGMRFTVSRIESDPVLDVAVLHVIEESTAWLRAGRADVGQRWSVRTQPAPNDPALDGSITVLRREYANRQGAAVGHQLQVEQDLDEYEGYSGSPVETSPGVVVGVLVEQVRSRLTSLSGEPVRAAPVLYATPIEEVEERFGLQERVTRAQVEGVDPSRALDRFVEMVGARLHDGSRVDGNYMELLLRTRAGDDATAHDPTEVPTEAPPHAFVAAKGARLLAIGEGGAGKTTAVLKLGMDLARDAVRSGNGHVPLYVPLNLAGTADGVTVEGILTLVAEQNDVDYEALRRTWLGGPQELVFLLDGLNEVRDDLEDDLIVALQRLMSSRRHSFLVTSRPTRAAEKLARRCDGLTVLDVVQLDEEQVDDYLDRRGLGRLSITMSRELKGLARNPFMLWALVQACADIEGPRLPTNAGQLYQLFLDDYVFRRREPAKANPGVSFDYAAVKRPALSWLAATMTLAGSTAFSVDDDTVDALATRLDECGATGARRRSLLPKDWAVEDFLDEVVYNGVLTRSGSSLTFMHESVQTYFTAVAMVTWPVERVVAAVSPLVWRWVEPGLRTWDSSTRPLAAAVVMLAGIDRAEELVEALDARNPMVAARCLIGASVTPEVRTRTIDGWSAMLSRRDARARLVAATCLRLARADSIAAVDALAACAADDSHPVEVAWEAVDALVAAATPLARTRLVQLAMRTSRSSERVRYMLARHSTADDFAEIIEAWRTTDASDARTFAESILARMDPDAFQLLHDHLLAVLIDSRQTERRADVERITSAALELRREVKPRTAWDVRDAMERGRKKRARILDRFLVADPPEILDALVCGSAAERQMAAQAAARRLPDAFPALLSALWREADEHMADTIAEAMSECTVPPQGIDALILDLQELRPVATLRAPPVGDAVTVSVLRQSLRDADLLVGPDEPDDDDDDDDAPADGRYVSKSDKGTFHLTAEGEGLAVWDSDRRARSATALAKVDPARAREALAELLPRVLERARGELVGFAAWESEIFVRRLVDVLGAVQARNAAPDLLGLLRSEMRQTVSALVLPLVDALSLMQAPAASVILEASTFIESDGRSERAWGTTAYSARGLSEYISAALRRFGATDEIRAWIREALADPAARTRLAAVRALGALRISADELATTALHDSDRGVRTLAAQELRWFDDGSWLALLEEALASDPHGEVREAAALALLEVSDPRSVARLVEALSDAEDRVRLAAAEALVDLSSDAAREHGVEALWTIVRAGSDGPATHAAELLTDMGACAWDAIPDAVLVAVLESSTCSTSARESAFKALGEFDGPTLAPLFELPARDAPPLVVENLSRLIVTPDDQAIPFFEQILLWQRSGAHAAVGALDQALDDLRRSRLAGSDPDSAMRLADLLEQAGRRDDARRLLADTAAGVEGFRPYAADDESSREAEARVRTQLGWLAYLDGDGDVAAAEAASASALGSGAVVGVVATFNLGLVQLVLGDPGEAAATYAEALARCTALGGAASTEAMADALSDLDAATGAPRAAAGAVRTLLVASRTA